jgi:beta-glucanase (GH16 family)
MPALPPVEPAPLTSPLDAGSGDLKAPSAPRGGPPRRHRAKKKKNHWRPALIVATAILSAAALAVALRVETGDHTTSAAAAQRTSASARVSTPAAHHTKATPRKSSARKAKAKPKTSSSSSSNSSSLSDAVMPTGNLPGWNLLYTQNFSGDSLPGDWGAYTGQPGGDPHGYWEPQNVSVNDGELHLSTTPDSDPDKSGAATSGGVAFYGEPQTYGMYLVRMKADYEPSLEMSDILLLWPSDNDWPPEVDFFEDSGAGRQRYATFLHMGPDGDDCCTIENSVANDATQWHTYGVAWTASTITYTVDGKVFAVVDKSNLTGEGQYWPNTSMNLDIQSENLGSAQPQGSVETMTVDWVAEYSQSS